MNILCTLVHVVFNDFPSRDVQLNSRQYIRDTALYRHLNTLDDFFVETGRYHQFRRCLSSSPGIRACFLAESTDRFVLVFFDVRVDTGVLSVWNPLSMSNLLAQLGEAPHHKTASG